MTNDEILTKMREGLAMQIHEAIERDDVPQAYVQQVTQSWLLLQMYDKIESMSLALDAMLDNSVDEWNERHNK